MQVAAQINQTLVQTLPVYGVVYNSTKMQVSSSLQSLNKIYQSSTQKISKARQISDNFTQQASWLLSQSAEQLLDLIEHKLNILNEDTSDHDKTKRILKILAELKNTYIINNLKKAVQYNGAALQWTKQQSDKYILPMYFTLKATIVVSGEIMMETLAERFGQLKMTYEVSKDTITMMFAGQFDEQTIKKRVSTNIDSFKQFTISFVKKGMQIKISKKDLHLNFTTVSGKLVEIVKGVSDKSKQQWVDAKTKTMNLYNSVLTRIKQKQVLIKTEYYKKTPVKQIKQE